MSSNSNEVDELMEQTHTKETKLEKFLRVVMDEQTMDYINKYLQENENPSNQANNKSDKIKLYQDLLIIQRFKAMEKKISNRKKIDEICQQLKAETNFSVSTIRERIQKKLSNVSKQEIINHIQNGVNFAFDSKRKLVSSKNIKNLMAQDDNLGLDDRTANEGQPRQQKKSRVIYVASSMEQSSVEQIPQKKTTGKKTNTIEQKQSDKDSKVRQIANPECYNQFRMNQDHLSDEQIIIIKEQSNQYKLSTVAGELILKEFMEKVANFYVVQKQKPKQEIQQVLLPPREQSKPEPLKQERISPIRTENVEVRNNVINLEFSDNSHQIDSESREDEMGPPPEELYWYCSVQDWKLATHSQQYSHLKWYQDEDDFLRKIVGTMSNEQAISSLQVLKKYKEGKNIVARLNKLGIAAPNHVMVNLLASQNQ